MPVITNEDIYEVLKSVQSQVALMHADSDSVKIRLSEMDAKLGPYITS